MSKCIRIGTRDSELALWQAKNVQSQLKSLGHETALIAVKSTGDLAVNKPIYELGISGVFTRTLDIALLNEEIDIAVHSLKDVPTTHPKGIVKAAVLKRGNVRDTLVFKNNEEFLAQRQAVIATGSLRRKAQWLNRYPTHSIEGLRGNVNTRLQKLSDSKTWNGAIFAAAGLGRIGLTPENAVNLEWMVPAPAQGAIVMVCLESETEVLEACGALNHEETEICTNMERLFLKELEGGCSAPIGALAFIKNEELSKKLSEDINEMEKMLNEYLQFTSSSYLEKDEEFNISELVDEIVKKYENENISSKITPRIYISGRKNLIKRCVNNLIDNAIKYAKKVNVDITKSSNNLFIKIEDNGPGIPEAEYDNVFKPFYKIDKGRAETKSSVGLGLSIASDIIRSHGGNIKLAKSPMGGLEAKIFLPF